MRPENCDTNFYLQENDEDLALQSGIWFKKAHVGYKRLNSFMNEIAKLSGVDVTDRKISNHSGRKMLIQGLQKLGISKEEIALQSRHKSLEGINAYTLHPEQQHYDMLNVFANKFQSTSQDSNSNTNAFKDQKEECFISSREMLNHKRLHESNEDLNNKKKEIH
ncbi:zinc finger MYM-type protein 2-like [Rhizophagus clarus]|uniref:Zinc finger MYM-type protein 2-like n=1 Tax=Rhizophagus clarus TaxID=94130 RepID=A0A8H3L6U8_9GLOM|nr:zinc finger MYM-type protein 2-like [Rhizophagus clarus]